MTLLGEICLSIFSITLGLIVFIMAPIFTIWMFNTLFAVGIEYGIGTWFAALAFNYLFFAVLRRSAK